MSYLPARPLQIQPAYVFRSYFWGALLLAAGIAIAASYVIWQLGDASRITQDQEVWAHGGASEDGSVNGTSRSRYGIFKEYTLNVVYTDNTGAEHVLVQNPANGWSYDNPADPTKVILHGADCNAVRNDPNGSVSVVLGCRTVTK